MTKSAQKFTFDTIFAEATDHVSDAARARQKKTLTQAEIDAIAAVAREEGFRSAEARALEAIAAGTRDAADNALKVLAAVSADVERVRASAVDIAMVIASKLARTALSTFPTGEVEAALREAMHQAIGEPRIVLRASPAVAESLSARIAEIAHEEGFDGRIQISPEPHLKGADCRIEWRGGGTERAEAAIEAALAEIVSRQMPNKFPITEE